MSNFIIDSFSNMYSGFKWLYLRGSEEPVVLKKSDAKKFRKMAYSISSIGSAVDVIRNNKLDKGSRYSQKMIKLVISVLEESMCNYDNPIYTNDANQVKMHLTYQSLLKTQQHAKLFHKVDRESDDFALQIKTTTDFLKQQVTQLSLSEGPYEEHILFQGGWPRHAVMYGIHKNLETNTYTFHLWNTGNGVSNHHSQDGKYKLRASWSQLNVEQITSEKFLSKLVKLKNPKNDLKVMSAKKIYNFINEYFQTERDYPPNNPKRYRHKQKEGICLWKSIWIPTSELLGYEDDPELALHIKADVIAKLHKKFLKGTEPDDLIFSTATKNVEARIRHRISVEANRKLQEANEKKVFHILNTIPGFNRAQLSSFSLTLKQQCFWYPESIKKICTPVKNPIKQLQSLNLWQILLLVGLFETEEGTAAYQEICASQSGPLILKRLATLLSKNMKFLDCEQKIVYTNITFDEYKNPKDLPSICKDLLELNLLDEAKTIAFTISDPDLRCETLKFAEDF
ncbi:MAG: hypothetical protein V4494_04575 [Chlamydiota bacterium]